MPNRSTINDAGAWIARGSRTCCAITLFLALAMFLASCGGGETGDDASVRDFEVREAVTGALENDRAIDGNATDAIESAKAGTQTLEAALDGFVDQTKSLLAVIASVSAPEEPPDKRLSQARELTAEYLRNRVHQIELALSATSPAELEALYAQGGAGLAEERTKIVKLLLEYDPELEKYIE